MSKGKDLIKNTGILMIAKISTQFVSFLLLPLYTALLTTAEYGEIDIYTSLTMIVIPFLTLQLEMGLFRFFITETSEKGKEQIITTTFSIIAVIIIVVSIIYLCIATLLDLKYAVYIFGFYLSMTISTVLLQVCRAYGNNKAYGVASFISSALAVCLNVLFIAGFNWKVEGILLSSIIAQFTSAIYIIVRTRVFRFFNFKSFNNQIGKKLLSYSTPLVFNQISSWAINYSDRLIIISFLGSSANGVYALANKFSNIMSTFFNVFNVAWTENVVRSLDDKDNDKYINQMFFLIFSLYLFLITGIINVLPFLFPFIVNENYNEAYVYIPILLLAIFFSGMSATIGSVYITYGKTKEISITTIMAGICNITVHIGLLKICGLYAASISTLLSFVVLFIYRYIFVKRFFRLNVNVWYMIIQIFIYMIAWVFYLIKNPILVVCGLLMNFTFIGLILKKYKEILYSIFIKK